MKTVMAKTLRMAKQPRREKTRLWSSVARIALLVRISLFHNCLIQSRKYNPYIIIDENIMCYIYSTFRINLPYLRISQVPQSSIVPS